MVARRKIVSSACGRDQAVIAPTCCAGMSPDTESLPQSGCSNGRRYWVLELGNRALLKEFDLGSCHCRDRHHHHDPDHEPGQTRTHRYHLSGGCAPKKIIAAIEQADRDQDPEIRLDDRILELWREHQSGTGGNANQTCMRGRSDLLSCAPDALPPGARY